MFSFESIFISGNNFTPLFLIVSQNMAHFLDLGDLEICAAPGDCSLEIVSVALAASSHSLKWMKHPMLHWRGRILMSLGVSYATVSRALDLPSPRMASFPSLIVSQYHDAMRL